MASLKGKIFVAIAILAISFSAYQIFAHPDLSKAKAEIKNSNHAKVSAGLIESYSAAFESTLQKCGAARGPQKNYISTGSPQITGLAGSLMAGKKNELEKARALFDFAANNISYRVYDSWRVPSEVLETKNGDCTDKSVLLVSMLKSAGIDAFVVYGKKVNGYSHAWVAAHIDGKWLQLDPTAKEFSYFYECGEDKNCKYKNYYQAEGMFDEREVLRCG